MWLIKFAWKNLWRNKSRTAITSASIFFAVILAVVTDSLYKGVFDNLISNMVSFYSGYIQVHKQGYWNEQVLDNSFEWSDSSYQATTREKNVLASAPRLESFALSASETITKGCMVTGIDPEEENKITRMKDKLVEGKYLEGGDRSVLLSEGLSRRLRLGLGDTVYLIGQGYHGATAAAKYPVSGILRFGSPAINDKLLLMPLLLAQDFYVADNRITSYALLLENNDRLHETASGLHQALGNDYEVMTWEEMMPEILQHMQTDTANMRIIQLILYILICFGILSTLIMMMAERRFEMGMLVALGMKKIYLALLVLIELAIVVVGGCLVGIVVSFPLVIYFNRNPIRFSGDVATVYERFGFEAIWPTAVDPGIFLTQGLIVLLIGAALSSYPVYKIFRLNAVQSMRRQV